MYDRLACRCVCIQFYKLLNIHDLIKERFSSIIAILAQSAVLYPDQNTEFDELFSEYANDSSFRELIKHKLLISIFIRTNNLNKLKYLFNRYNFYRNIYAYRNKVNTCRFIYIYCICSAIKYDNVEILGYMFDYFKIDKRGILLSIDKIVHNDALRVFEHYHMNIASSFDELLTISVDDFDIGKCDIITYALYRNRIELLDLIHKLYNISYMIYGNLICVRCKSTFDLNFKIREFSVIKSCDKYLFMTRCKYCHH